MANLDRMRFSNLLLILESLDLRVVFPNGLRADLLDAEHVQKLSEMSSGLKVSLESAVRRVQREIICKNLDPESVWKVAEICQQYSLPLEVHGIIGLPGETRAEIMETLRYCDSLHEKFHVVPRIQFATPLPGTNLHDTCIHGEFISKDKYDISAAFTSSPVIRTREFDERFLMTAMGSFNEKIQTSEHDKVIVNLTYRCNNRCVFCAVGDRKAGDADLDEVLEKISEYREKGIDLLDIDGGEPTLHPGLMELLQRAKVIGFEKISLITNGRRASYPRFARKLVSTGVDEILVSLHSSQPAIQEQITNVTGSFDQTVRGIENLLDALGDSRSIAINTTMVKNNIGHLDSMGEFLVSMGIKRWNLQLVTPFGRAQREQVPSKEEVLGTIGKLVRDHAQSLTMHIINIPPCDLPGFEQLAAADFEKAHRHMVFVGESGQNLQSYLASRRRPVEKCTSCPWSLVCPGEYFFDNA